eukprot:TRINITY_DN13060_c0_g1_i1.p1 TRINITY_DN13060_c0_g1~~TRINITY_DN13060_c0_g1_i1.p1  ORF type:complete len:104 (+),score=37.23 TRINITY_DN13060_c0_g1_i1:48-314(+)
MMEQNSSNLIENRPIAREDAMFENCKLCKVKFTMFKRKHHCRACGFVFCDNCTKSRLELLHLGYNNPQRVCDECKDKLVKKTNTSNTE